MSRNPAAALTAHIAGASSANGIPGTWSVEPARTTARFSVRDKLVATVHGTIPVVQGTVEISSEGQVVGGHAELDLTRIATGNEHRDRDLTKRHLLDAEGHPTLVVDALHAEAGEFDWQVAATLSARGAQVPVTLHASPVSADDRGVRMSITGRLDRRGLRMRVPTFVIGRYVDIEVDAFLVPPEAIG